jgi:BirA family biotin operon repressor/biotin-[acetyl-CoA-carboxylase] ligase
VRDALRSLGVNELRVRWPNDVLVGQRKLAGLLIDHFGPDRSVVGVGINVTNHPEQQAGDLAGQVARLADLASNTPTLEQLTRTVLTSLEKTLALLEMRGPEVLLPRINALWETSPEVQLDLDGAMCTGQFQGVDDAGRLLLRIATGETIFYEPHQVRLLRELPNP